MLVAATVKGKMMVIDIPVDTLREYPSFSLIVNEEELKGDALRQTKDKLVEQGDSQPLLISCFQGGFGDQLLLAWLIPYIWQHSGYPMAIAVLPAERPRWLHRVLSGLSLWQLSRHWPMEDQGEIDKYDGLISAAAHSVGVGHVETLGPIPIPTRGDWSRCDDDLYTRLARLAAENIFPQCPFPPAVPGEVDSWLAGQGLGKLSQFVVVHARSETVSPYKNPRSERIRALAKLLLGEFPLEVLLLGECPGIDGDYGGRFSLCREHLPPELLAGVLSRAAAFIGGDSGLRHLAGLVGTSLITFASSRDRGFGPFVPAAQIHRVPIPASPGDDETFDFDPLQVAEEVARVSKG